MGVFIDFKLVQYGQLAFWREKVAEQEDEQILLKTYLQISDFLFLILSIDESRASYVHDRTIVEYGEIMSTKQKQLLWIQGVQTLTISYIDNADVLIWFIYLFL